MASLVRALLSSLNAWFTDLEYRLRTRWPFALGSGGRRVFFPGCALTAADPALTLKTYEWLKERDPTVELWSDCCGMPLEKFSTPEAAARGRARTRRLLESTKTTEVITACGNCRVQFKSLQVPGLRLTSVYRLLAEEDWGPRAAALPSIVHHPCSARVDPTQQEDFGALASRLGLSVSNSDSKGHPLACCLVRTPSAMKRREALAGQHLITYCAHCTVSFQDSLPSRHVLQEAFGTAEERWVPRGKVGRLLQYFRFARMARGAGQRSGASGPRNEARPQSAAPVAPPAVTQAEVLTQPE